MKKIKNINEIKTILIKKDFINFIHGKQMNKNILKKSDINDLIDIFIEYFQYGMMNNIPIKLHGFGSFKIKIIKPKIIKLNKKNIESKERKKIIYKESRLLSNLVNKNQIKKEI